MELVRSSVRPPLVSFGLLLGGEATTWNGDCSMLGQIRVLLLQVPSTKQDLRINHVTN